MMKILFGVHMAHSIIHLYVHFNISVIHLLSITQMTSYYRSPRAAKCYRPHGDKEKNVNFY